MKNKKTRDNKNLPAILRITVPAKHLGSDGFRYVRRDNLSLLPNKFDILFLN